MYSQQRPTRSGGSRLNAFAVLLVIPSLLAGDWPQWRGANRDGVWEQAGLPDKLGPNAVKLLWRGPIGGGYGGIAVAGSRLVVMDRQTEGEGKERERVLCLDARSGASVWKHEYSVDYKKMDYGNGPRSTPTLVGDRVFTLGGVGHLCCLEAATGKVVWTHDCVKEFGARIPMWGLACSPLMHGDRLYVQIGGEPNGCFMAFDAKNGREIWRALADRPGYSSPVLVNVGGENQLLAWTAEHLTGLDPGSGAVFWKVPHTTEYDVTITDPVLHDGVILVSDYWKGSIALRLDEKGRNPKRIWDGKRLSMLMSTPLVRDGYAYALDRSNGLKCVELKSGAIKWEGKHVTPKEQNPQVSLAWVGDRMLALNARGELVMGRLSPEAFEPLGKVSLIGDTWAHPAFARGCVFARNDKEIVCYALVRGMP